MNENPTETDYIMNEFLSITEVAKLINKSDTYVSAKRKELGIKFSREIKLNECDLMIIRDTQYSNKEVSEILKNKGIQISPNTIARKRKKMNVIKHATRSDLVKIYSANGIINKDIEKDLSNSKLSSNTIAKKYNISNFSVMLMRQNKLITNTYDISINYNNPDNIKQLLNVGLTNDEVTIILGVPKCSVIEARKKMKIRYLGKCFRPENYKYIIATEKYTVSQCSELTNINENMIRIVRSKIKKDPKKYDMNLLFKKITSEFINDFSSNNDILTNERIKELSKKYDLSLDITRFLSKKIKKDLSEKEKELIIDLNNLVDFTLLTKKYNINLSELDLFMNKNKDSLNMQNILIADAIYSKEYTTKEIAIMFNCKAAVVNYVSKKIKVNPIKGYSKRLLYVNQILDMINNDIDIKTISEKTRVDTDVVIKIKRQDFARRLYELKYEE